jgi:hypothetical protein
MRNSASYQSASVFDLDAQQHILRFALRRMLLAERIILELDAQQRILRFALRSFYLDAQQRILPERIALDLDAQQRILPLLIAENLDIFRQIQVKGQVKTLVNFKMHAQPARLFLVGVQ